MRLPFCGRGLLLVALAKNNLLVFQMRQPDAVVGLSSHFFLPSEPASATQRTRRLRTRVETYVFGATLFPSRSNSIGRGSPAVVRARDYELLIAVRPHVGSRWRGYPSCLHMQNHNVWNFCDYFVKSKFSSWSNSNAPI